MHWSESLARSRRDGTPVVLVTLVEIHGHSPRAAGAKMVVGEGFTTGSIGGGALEHRAIGRARELLTTMAATGAGTPPPAYLDHDLSAHADHDGQRQCCGGRVRVLLEALPSAPAVVLFGFGHVGYELARILSRCEVHLTLVDSRPGQLDPLRLDTLSGGPAILVTRQSLIPEQALATAPAGAHVLVMTHDHAEDFAICDAALRDSRVASIGLIGSAAKWARFRRLLVAEGHDPAAVDAIRCPVGSGTLRGKEPAVVAVDIAGAVLRDIERGAEADHDRGVGSTSGATP